MDIISKEDFDEYLLNMQRAGKTCIQALVDLAQFYSNENGTQKELIEYCKEL